MLTRKQFLNQKRDYSELLVHLTRAQDGKTAVEVLVEILKSYKVKAFRAHCLFNDKVEKLPAVGNHRFNVACFSECPLAFVRDIVVPVEGRKVQLETYGVFVTKEVVKADRGNPVLYINWPATDKFHEMWDLLEEGEEWRIMNDIMPFVSLIGDKYDFHWEREWRVPGGLTITPAQVPFILCPEGDIWGLREALEEKLLDEWLDVPIVDATWSPERMVEEVAKSARGE